MSVGGVPPGHLIDPQLIVYGVPLAVSSNVNEPTEPVAGGLVIAIAVDTLAFNETAKKLAVSRFNVSVPADIAGVARVSL